MLWAIVCVTACHHRPQNETEVLRNVKVTQPIYTGGKIRTGNRLARIGKDCADESRRKIRMQVIADADCTYWTYIAVNEKIKMLLTIKVRQAIQNVTDGYNMIKTAELGQKQAGENLRASGRLE